MRVTAAEIDLLCELIRKLCGVDLDASKAYLIESRLSDLALRHGCTSFRELAERVRGRGEPALRTEIVDAITTNETSFFREASAFETLVRQAIPDLMMAKQAAGESNTLRLWSAGCSTGQEPYSLAIALEEAIPALRHWHVSIQASDISESVLRQADRGVYTPVELARGMRVDLISKYFLPEGSQWRVTRRLRQLVEFEQLNLLESMPAGPAFDVIFCRNVAIYFTPATRSDVFQRMCDVLAPNGYLFAGAMELLGGLGPKFAPRYFQGGVYYRPNLSREIAFADGIDSATCPGLASARRAFDEA